MLIPRAAEYVELVQYREDDAPTGRRAVYVGPGDKRETWMVRDFVHTGPMLYPVLPELGFVSDNWHVAPIQLPTWGEGTWLSPKRGGQYPHTSVKAKVQDMHVGGVVLWLYTNRTPSGVWQAFRSLFLGLYLDTPDWSEDDWERCPEPEAFNDRFNPALEAAVRAPIKPTPTVYDMLRRT